MGKKHRHTFTPWTKWVDITDSLSRPLGRARAQIVDGTPQTPDWRRHCLGCHDTEVSHVVKPDPCAILTIRYTYPTFLEE